MIEKAISLLYEVSPRVTGSTITLSAFSADSSNLRWLRLCKSKAFQVFLGDLQSQVQVVDFWVVSDKVVTNSNSICYMFYLFKVV